MIDLKGKKEENKETKNMWEAEINENTIAIKSAISIITLNVNGLIFQVNNKN